MLPAAAAGFLLWACLLGNSADASNVVKNVAPNAELTKFSLLPRGLPTGTCDATTPCVNAACCGTNGLCGYSPTECGAGNCTSNCDAKAACGQYAATGQQTCPLNVCCSQFGFCGSTDDFCQKGCQAGFGSCGPPKRPSCGSSSGSATKRTIGYYESWSNTRKCQSVSPEDLNLSGFTHINFAFAFFDPSTFAIAPMDGKTGALYNRFTALKRKKSGLQTWISVGGWSFTDPGPTRTAFSDMSSTASNRAAFISGLKQFMATYGFDGVDLDWEYPQADDRGGVSADKANYVTLVKEMRAAFGNTYGISMTLPSSFWYLQHFDLANIQPNVDWFNLMSYDLHGTWDAESQFVGPYIATHTNLTEIDMAMDLLWRAGVESGKVVLGQGWYGRSFTLASSSCNVPNGVCKFTGGADAGPCSNAAGILDLQEIKDIISQKGLTPQYDEKAAVKWITWDSNQWVSYDDDDTFAQKRQYAASLCLGGTMVWAMDQVDQSSDNNVNGVTSGQLKDAQQKSDNLRAGLTCYATACGDTCKKGTNSVTQMNGQPGQLSVSDRCPSGKYRTLCCDDGTSMGTCKWRGYRGAGLSCLSGCDDGETEVVTDTNNHGKSGDQTCNGGLQSYCCAGFKPAAAKPSKSDVKRKAEDAAEDAAKAAAEAVAQQVALDVAAKAFCRLAVPALLLPLELLEDLIPIVGEILDIAEVAATPALIKLCTDEVEKEGQAEFKVFGKKHTISGFSKPTVKPSSTRPPKSSHTSAKTSTKSDDSCSDPGGNVKRAGNRPCRQIVKCAARTVAEYVDGPVGNLVCNPAKFDQPCNHYASVIAGNPALYNDLPCFTSSSANFVHSTKEWYDKHQPWTDRARANHGKPCDADEWPPAYFWTGDQNKGAVWIRYCDSHDNEGAGQLWRAFCPKVAERSTRTGDIQDGRRIVGPHGGKVTYEVPCTVTYTRKTMHLDVPGAVAPYRVVQNDCRPVQPDDPGFALQINDQWYVDNPTYQQYTDLYAQPPTRKRGVGGWFDPDEVIFDDGNSTRKATDEELRERYGFIRCTDEKCSREMNELGIKSAIRVAPEPTAPVAAPATAATPTGTATIEESMILGSPWRSHPQQVSSATMPKQT